MYKVPLDIPTHCNTCPFGYCIYSYPLGGASVSDIDGEQNPPMTYGWVCNLDFVEHKKHTKIVRGIYVDDIPKPNWCGLIEESE